MLWRIYGEILKNFHCSKKSYLANDSFYARYLLFFIFLTFRHSGKRRKIAARRSLLSSAVSLHLQSLSSSFFSTSSSSSLSTALRFVLFLVEMRRKIQPPFFLLQSKSEKNLSNSEIKISLCGSLLQYLG